MKISKSTKYNIILGTIYLCLLLIPSIIIESYYKGKGGILDYMKDYETFSQNLFEGVNQYYKQISE